ncbi:MAG: hypothetical protein WD771_05415 [Gemmatimonadaceae bacterium]
MRRSVITVAFGTLVGVAACGPVERASAPPLTLAVEPSPTATGAAEPNLFTTADGRVLMSWLEPTADGAHALRLAVRGADGAWSAPSDVVRRRDLFVNWADFPSVVALSDGRFLAHWLQRSGSGRYAYDVRLAESRDGGATWKTSVQPHRGGIPAEHGFVSILPDRDGGASIFFLDGSAGVGDTPAPAGHDHGPGPMHLSVNAWGAAIADSTKRILDTRVCDCCQTAAAMTARGPVVVYRDRSDTEVRDISILRQVNGEWTAPHAVHDDHWVINACPVNGPAIVADGERLAVAWFTGARDTAKVLLAFSTDAGTTFGAPIRIDEGTPAGRVGLQWLDEAVLVSWLERGGADTAYVKVRRVMRDGTMEDPIVISNSSGTRSSGFPRMTRLGDGVLLAWTLPGAPGAPSAVQAATLRTVAP